MILEDIDKLIVGDVQSLLENRLKIKDKDIIDALLPDEEYVILPEELDAEFLLYKAELVLEEEKRLAEIVRVQQLHVRKDALKDFSHSFDLLNKGPNKDLYFKEEILEASPVISEALMKELESKDISIEASRLVVEYKELRKAEYPPIAEQLDILYHSGVAGLKAALKVIKDKYPKP